MEEKADPQSLPACPRNKRPHGNVPEKFDLREELYRIVGVDLTSIDGVNGLTVQTLIAEAGFDMSRWATEGSFVSWLNLAPNNTLLRSQTYLGAQYRRLRTKLGTPKAVKAMAAKLARIIYRALNYGQAYVDKGGEFYELKYRHQQIKILCKKAAELGLQVVHSA
jgi:transposase